MTQMQTTVEHVEPGCRDLVRTGPQHEVTAWARQIAHHPKTVAVWKPEPDPVRPGYAIARVRLRSEVQPATARQAARTMPLPDPVWPRLAPAWWERLTPDQRRLASVAVMVVGGLVLLVGVAWLLVAAVTGAVRAATSNVPVLLLLALVAGIFGWLWLRWKLRSQSQTNGSRRSCAGLVQHCNGCSDH